MIFKVLCFLMMCPILSALFIILVGLTISLFSDEYVVRCPTWSKNLGRYLIRTIRHLSRSWQKNGCMYGSLTYSSLVLLTSFPWSFTVCIHTYFLIPFLFACDSLYNPKTQLFRSCYFVLVTKYQTLGGMDSSFEHPKPALFYILAHLPLIIGNVCLSG